MGAPLPLFLSHERSDVGTKRRVYALTHGRYISAANTGLNYRGVSEASLTPAGSSLITYSTPGQTITGMLFTNQVRISADNITLRDCLWVGGAKDMFAVQCLANNFTMDGCTVRGTNGPDNPTTSWYICCFLGVGTTGGRVFRCDLANGKTQLTNHGTNTVVTENYIHDTSLVSDPLNHADNTEIYGGDNVLFQYNNMQMGPLQADGSINISPFTTGGGVVQSDNGIYIFDNFIDGGKAHILAGGPPYSSNPSLYIQVLRNDFGGHTNPDHAFAYGTYMAASYWQQHGLSETYADQVANAGWTILWPSSGPDVNYWRNTYPLSPNLEGQVAMPLAVGY